MAILNTEHLFKIIGGKGKYQWIVTLLLFLMAIGSTFVFEITPLMSSKPKVEYFKNGEKQISVINYEICNGKFGKYNITHYTNNWAYEFDYYCDEVKTSLMESSLLVGNVIGLIILKFYPFPKENFIKINQIFYSLTFSLIFIKNFWAVVVMNFLQGISYFSAFVTKNTIITEITDKDSRALFYSILFFSKILLAFISPFLYQSINYIGWVNLYGLVCLFQMVVTGAIIYYIKINPREYIISNDLDKAFTSSLFIAEENGRIDHHSTITIEDEENNELSIDYLNQNFTEYQLKAWIKKNFFISSNDLKDKETFDSTNILTDIKGKYSKGINYFTLKNLNLLIFYCCYTFALFTINYEKQKYTEYKNFNFFYQISVGCSALFFYPHKFLMDSNIGRKGAIAIVIGLIIFARGISMIIYHDMTIIAFFLIYILNYIAPISVHNFMTESFTNTERISTYSLMSIISKITTVAIPYTLEYLEEILFNSLNILLLLIVLITLYFTKETKGKQLED